MNKIYRFMWRKGQLLQILSTHSAQHKIYRFIWRKWRFFFKLQNMDFSWLHFGLQIGLFAEIFEPEGVVFHKYYDYKLKTMEHVLNNSSSLYFNCLPVVSLVSSSGLNTILNFKNKATKIAVRIKIKAVVAPF